jgi:uncharacterized surface protein with fasciclin (FAS1) repeats
MKNLKKIIGIALLAISITSCSDDDDKKQTIAEIAIANPNLSTLVAALQRADLVDTFNASGDFTVFAPTNAAFETLLGPGVSVNTVPVPVLTEILNNHVLGQSYTSSELETGYYKTLAKGAASTTNTLSMYIDLTSGVKINGGETNGGANVVLANANIVASNGVIHVVDRVIGLPTVKNHAIANPNFSKLTALLVAQNLAGALDATASTAVPSPPFTVFAPINSAFSPAVETLYGSLSSERKTAVLLYHVVGGLNVLSNAIPTGQIPTLQGQSFSITGTAINDAGSTVNKNIVVTNVQCSNGIVHAIDGVLLPIFN